MHRYGAKIIATIVCAMALALCLLAACTSSPSSTYSIESVRIDAQVQTDATLRVIEHRLLDLSPDQPSSSGTSSASSSASSGASSETSSNAAASNQLASAGQMTMVRYQQTYAHLDKNQSITVNDIRVAIANDEGIVEGEWIWLTPVEFDPAWRNGIPNDKAEELAEIGSYTFDSKSGRFYVLFNALSSVRIMLELDYNVHNGAQVYKDTGDVSFKYINDTELTVVRNVTCVISLPVPEGQQAVPNSNVYAWGHGPEDGAVRNAGATITYETPLVKPNQYVEAHVMLPRAWLMNATDPTAYVYRDELHFSWALDAEKAWQDAWRNASMNDDRISIGLAVLCVLLLLAAGCLLLKFRRERKPSDPLAADVQALAQTIHPATAVRLKNGGRVTDEEFAATVVRLRSENQLKACWKGDGESSDYCLKRASFGFESDTLDAAALEILETLGLNDSLSAHEAPSRARKNREAFLAAVRKWRKEIDEAFAAASFEDEGARAWGKRLKVCALALIGLAVIVAIASSCYPACVLLVVTAAGLWIVAQAMHMLSQRGIDVLAARSELSSAGSPERASSELSVDACGVSDEELTNAVLEVIPKVFDEAQKADTTVFTRMHDRFPRTEKR